MKPFRIILCILAFTSLLALSDYAGSYWLKHGLDINLGLDREADMLILGHSHITLATDKKRMEDELGITISKYARPGVNVEDRYVMARQYLSLCHSGKLKCVLYGVDQFSFCGEGLSANTYKLFYPWMDDPEIDTYIQEQSSREDYWVHKLLRLTRYTDEVVNASISGWRHQWINRKNGVIDINTYKHKLNQGDERRISINPELLQKFKQTLDLFTSRGIKVILVNPPTIDLLHHFDAQSYTHVDTIFRQFAEASPLIEYYDLNPALMSRHELFRDPIHLNSAGQAETTGRLIAHIKRKS